MVFPACKKLDQVLVELGVVTSTYNTIDTIYTL